MYNNLTVEMAKQHLNIDTDFRGDDEYLCHLIEASSDAVSAYINSPLSVYKDEEGNLPSNLTHAILLLVGHYFNSREAVSYAAGQPVPLAYQFLLDKYVNYSGDYNNNIKDEEVDNECRCS